jgi:CxxC-x17-CxxC domain-containing protein
VYNDKNLTCADCGQEFVFTASEQDFYAQRGFTEPRRCASCRASRKAARNANGGGSYGSSGGGSSSYGSYGAGGGYSAGGSYTSGGSSGGGYGSSGGGYRDRGPREMFTATCSSCGREAQVPFRPTSGKPVYCSDCFRSQRGGSSY